MVPERSRSRKRLAVLVVRRLRPPTDRESWTTQGQRVLTIPAEQPAPRLVATSNNRPDMAKARLLLAHAHRARHLLADRSVLASVQSTTHRTELVQEIQRMRGVMHTLEEQIQVTTRSLEAMERLVLHLRRVTELLQEAGVMAVTRREADSNSR